jgi:hypothetical protein
MIAIDLSGFLEEFGVDRGKEEVSKFAVLKIAGAGPCLFASR